MEWKEKAEAAAEKYEEEKDIFKVKSYKDIDPPPERKSTKLSKTQKQIENAVKIRNKNSNKDAYKKRTLKQIERAAAAENQEEKKIEGKRKPNISKYNPYELNQQIISNNNAYINSLKSALVFYNLPRVTNDEDLETRLEWFFKVCMEHNIYMSYEKMCLALGFSSDWVQGVISERLKGFSPRTKEILQRNVQVLMSVDAEMATGGKTQPVVYMFRAKNFYGMADNRYVNIEHHTYNDDKPSKEAIEAKYKALKK